MGSKKVLSLAGMLLSSVVISFAGYGMAQPPVDVFGAAVWVTSDNILGSGVFIDPTHILTAGHVASAVAATDEWIVHLADGSTLHAHQFKVDGVHDVGVLELDKGEVAPMSAQMACDPKLAVGQQIKIIGDPQGIGMLTTWGPISALKIAFLIPWPIAFVVDAVIAEGSSGGPLFNGDDQIVGISVGVPKAASQASEMGMDTGAYVPVAIAVPSTAICPDLKQWGLHA